MGLGLLGDARQDVKAPSTRRAATRAGSMLTMSLILFVSLFTYLHQGSFFTLSELSFPFGVPNFQPLSSSKIKWEPCKGHEKDAHLDCTTIEAPKDYFNSSAGSVYIALARYKATRHGKDRKGSIFINPGGPGGSGKGFAYRMGPLMSTLFEGAYDLIGFDPRGIGDTRPRVNCFGSARKLALFKSGTFLDRPFDVAPDLFSQENVDLQTRQWAEVQALRRVEMEKCTAEMGADELRYMSSSSVVRDLDYMSRQLEGEDAPINFIGASYGTVLGAYLANMLPAHRLGRIAIDGVVCPRDWSTMPSEYWLKEWLVDAEQAYDWFLEACERAGPDECALMQSSTDTAAKIDRRLEDLVEALYHSPIPVAHASRPGLLTSGVIRTMQYDLTYAPQRWPLYSDLFADVLAKNYTRLFDFFYESFPLDDSDKNEEELSRAAVTCGDVTPYADSNNGNWPLPSPELLANVSIQTFKETTRRFAVSSAAREPDGGCEFHPALGKTPERFVGPWNNTLTNSPLLIISNTADPATPRKCGLQVLELMGPESARLVTQNSPGHCSYRSVATCTWRAYRDYFLHGITPPPEGQYCDVDDDYFHLGGSKHRASTIGVNDGASVKDDEFAALASGLSQAWSNWDDLRRSKSRGIHTPL